MELLPELWHAIALLQDAPGDIVTLTRVCMQAYIGIGGRRGALPLLLDRRLSWRGWTLGPAQHAIAHALPLHQTLLNPLRLRQLVPTRVREDPGQWADVLRQYMKPILPVAGWTWPMGAKMIAGGAAAALVLRWVRSLHIATCSTLLEEFGDVDVWRWPGISREGWLTDVDGHAIDAPVAASHMNHCCSKFACSRPCEASTVSPIAPACSPMECFDNTATQWAILPTGLIYCTPLAFDGLFSGRCYTTSCHPSLYAAVLYPLRQISFWTRSDQRRAMRLLKYHTRGFQIAAWSVRGHEGIEPTQRGLALPPSAIARLQAFLTECEKHELEPLDAGDYHDNGADNTRDT